MHLDFWMKLIAEANPAWSWIINLRQTISSDLKLVMLCFQILFVKPFHNNQWSKHIFAKRICQPKELIGTLPHCKIVFSKIVKRHSMCYSALWQSVEGHMATSGLSYRQIVRVINCQLGVNAKWYIWQANVDRKQIWQICIYFCPGIAYVWDWIE